MRKFYDNYIEYTVKSVQQIKSKYGYRVVLRYADGSEVIQQDSGYVEKKDAEEARIICEAELIQGTYLANGNILLKDFMKDCWLEEIRTNVTVNTMDSYASVVKNHVIPLLGNKRIKDINRADIVRLYKTVFAFSESVARLTKTVMKTFLDFAVSRKAAKVNVALDISLPKGAKKQVAYHSRTINADKTLSYDQVLRLIETAKGTPLYVPILLAVVCGLRISECIAVKYSDINFIDRELMVKRQLGRDPKKPKEAVNKKEYTKQEIPVKTNSSYRTIKLPDIVFNAILEERNLYKKRKNRRKREFQDLDYIVCSTYGRPRSKGYIYAPYKELLVKAGLPDIRFHDLRSTAITQLLLNDASLKAVATNMGHEHEIVTVDSYTDKRKLSIVKLDRLDDFIEKVRPDNVTGTDNSYLSEIRIDVDEYVPTK